MFKKDKAGLAGRFKIMGQVILGVVVGAVLYFNPSVVIKEKVLAPFEYGEEADMLSESDYSKDRQYVWKESKSMKTTIPFLKNNEFDYSSILGFLGEGGRALACRFHAR